MAGPTPVSVVIVCAVIGDEFLVQGRQFYIPASGCLNPQRP